MSEKPKYSISSQVEIIIAASNRSISFAEMQNFLTVVFHAFPALRSYGAVGLIAFLMQQNIRGNSLQSVVSRWYSQTEVFYSQFHTLSGVFAIGNAVFSNDNMITWAEKLGYYDVGAFKVHLDAAFRETQRTDKEK